MMLNEPKHPERSAKTMLECLGEAKVSWEAGNPQAALLALSYLHDCQLENVNGELVDLLEECCVIACSFGSPELLMEFVKLADTVPIEYQTRHFGETRGFLLLQVGRRLYEQNRTNEASRYLKQVDPENAYYVDALKLRADIALQTGHRGKAKNLYEQLLEYDPGCAHAYLQMFEICCASDDLVGAIHYFQEVKKAFPGDPRQLEWARKLRAKFSKHPASETVRARNYRFKNARWGVPERINLPTERACQKQYYVQSPWVFPKIDQDGMN